MGSFVPSRSYQIANRQGSYGGSPVSGSASGGGAGGGGGSAGGGGGTVSSPSLGNLFNELAKDYEAAQKEQQTRYTAGLSELTEAAGLFGPEYGAGMEQAALAGAKQSLIGRGLGGTTRPMAVGAGMKAQFEDLRRGKLATALQQLAEYRKTSPQIYPAAGVLSNLALGSRSSALEERAMNQPMTIAAGSNSQVGGPGYLSAAQSWAAPLSGGGVNNNGSWADFTLPFI